MASGSPFVRRIDARPFAESAKLHPIEIALLPKITEGHIAMYTIHLQDGTIHADGNAASVQDAVVWRDLDGELLEPIGQPL
jgi:hypothetical protein